MTVNTKNDRDFIKTANEAVDMYHGKKGRTDSDSDEGESGAWIHSKGGDGTYQFTYANPPEPSLFRCQFLSYVFHTSKPAGMSLNSAKARHVMLREDVKYLKR